MGKNRTRKRYKNKRRSIDKLLTKYENILLAVFYVINSKILLQIYIKDGKIYNEIRKGNDTRKQFFEKIIEVVTLLGGDLNDVI